MYKIIPLCHSTSRVKHVTPPISKDYGRLENCFNSFESLLSDNGGRLRLIQVLKIFEPTPDIQIDLSSRINIGVFGRDPKVLSELIQILSIFKEPAAQLELAAGIVEKLSGRGNCFGYNPEVLTKLVQNLSIFKDPNAQRILSRGIMDNCFGHHPKVLTALAKTLLTFNDPNSPFFNTPLSDRYNSVVNQLLTKLLSSATKSDPVYMDSELFNQLSAEKQSELMRGHVYPDESFVLK